MQTRSTRSLVFIGFGVMFLILAMLIVFWIQSVYLAEKRLQKVISEQQELKLITIMRETTYKRAMSILRMSVMDDTIDQSDEYNKFRLLASDFIHARDQLLKHHLDEQEYSEWAKIRPHIRKSQIMQNNVAEMYIESKNELARKTILNEGIPAQNNVNTSLKNLANNTEVEIRKVSEEAVNYGNRIYLLILVLTVCALGIGAIVARFVITRISKSESQIVETSSNLRRLYSVSSMSGISIEEQIQKMLELGCEMLGMQEGSINKLESISQKTIVLYAFSENNQIKPGYSVSLKDSLCGFTLSTSEPLAIENMDESEFRDFSRSEQGNLQAYIATSFIIKGKKYGSISFMSDKPRAVPFSEADKDLVNLIASWVSFALERSLDHHALTDLKDRAEQANQAKSEFLGNMSHELRTPMHAILSYASFGVKRFDTASGPKKLSYFSKIQKSANNLLGMLNNLLDLAKLESGKLEIEIDRWNFHDLVTEVFDEVKSLCDDNHLRLLLETKSDEVIVEIDADRIRQVIRNLLGNAIKFSPENTTIKVRFGVDEGELHFSVTDRGPGIPESELSDIFDKFIQSSKTKTGAGGTGLGLSICREIITAHHGNIWATNNSYGGAMLSFSLPTVSSKPESTQLKYA